MKKLLFCVGILVVGLLVWENYTDTACKVWANKNKDAKAHIQCLLAVQKNTAASFNTKVALAKEQLREPLLNKLSNKNQLDFNLEWERVEQAVSYKVEILDEENFAAWQQGAPYIMLWQAENIHVPGCNVLLPETYRGKTVYWRVRGLSLDKEPLNTFSSWQSFSVPQQLANLRKPRTLEKLQKGRGASLLYPVYTWIPLQGVNKYEVEILSAPPENPNGTTASRYRLAAQEVTGFDWYDDSPRISQQALYWRVIGKNEQGRPVGVYSNAIAFQNNPQHNYQIGVLGDSITHGGGSISYPPTNLAYSYLHYLDFNAINLGESGDTSEATLQRFDADVLPFHLQYLLIMTGSNSLRGGVSADSVIADLQELKRKSLAHGIKPVFLTLPPLNPQNIKKGFNQPTVENWQEEFAKVNTFIRSQVYIDTAAGLSDARGELPTALALEGLHMDPPGKQKMAEAINAAWPYILQLPDSSWQ